MIQEHVLFYNYPMSVEDFSILATESNNFKFKIMEILSTQRDKHMFNKVDVSIPLELFWYSTLLFIICFITLSALIGHTVVVCSVFKNLLRILTFLSKHFEVSIYHCIRYDHDSSSFWKLAKIIYMKYLTKWYILNT